MSNPLAQQQARECLRTSILPERVRDFADLAPLLAASSTELATLAPAYLDACAAYIAEGRLQATEAIEMLTHDGATDCIELEAQAGDASTLRSAPAVASRCGARFGAVRFLLGALRTLDEADNAIQEAQWAQRNDAEEDEE